MREECGSGTGVGEEVFYWAERCGRGARGMKSICQELYNVIPQME